MNKIYKLAIVLGVFAMFGIRGVEAQTNIATTATAAIHRAQVGLALCVD